MEHKSRDDPLVLNLAIASVIAFCIYYYLLNNQQTTPQLRPTSDHLGMAYTTIQNKAIADFRAITNVDKTTAARVLKANAWNVQQTVNRYQQTIKRPWIKPNIPPASTPILAPRLPVRLVAG